MKTTKLTIEQSERLLVIDAQYGEKAGFTAGFVILLESKGVPVNKAVDYIVDYVKPSSSLRMQLFGVHHNLTH